MELGRGTDGPGSNNSLDLLASAKLFALLHKHETRDPAAVTALGVTLKDSRGGATTWTIST